MVKKRRVGKCVLRESLPCTLSRSTMRKHQIPTSSLLRRVAAARELLEETGLDMRESMHRLVPVDMEVMGERGQKLHQSRRRFFRLDINDSDSVDDIRGGCQGLLSRPVQYF